MAIYAIGDVQGCYDQLIELVDHIQFKPEKDQLWFVGDLVNRGDKSLEVLRYVKGLGNSARVVLGNHDLHLLALAAGLAPGKASSDLQKILTAPDRDVLLDWLVKQPLLYHDSSIGYTMIHAGLAPQWSLKKAKKLAREVESVLQSEERYELFAAMYKDTPKRWKNGLKGIKRQRFIINCFTRLRYCGLNGENLLSIKGSPDKTQTLEATPWFEVPERKSQNKKIVFGHWSTLGLKHKNNALSLDTGCVWGGTLTAARIDITAESTDFPHPIFSIPCPVYKKPG